MCESKSERRRGLRILRSMYYIRVKAWGFRVSFLFVRVTVKVTSNRWTLLMQISCCIYGTIRQHTGQIFECFRHADDILCHLVFSTFFLILLYFLIDYRKTKLDHCTLEYVNAKWIGIWKGREKKIMKVKLNYY